MLLQTSPQLDMSCMFKTGPQSLWQYLHTYTLTRQTGGVLVQQVPRQPTGHNQPMVSLHQQLITV